MILVIIIIKNQFLKMAVLFCICLLELLFFIHLSAVAKNKLVQVCIVRCQLSQSFKTGSKKSHTKRSSIQDCYRRTEIWSLQDLSLVDGRDPDVVNIKIYFHLLTAWIYIIDDL